MPDGGVQKSLGPMGSSQISGPNEEDNFSGLVDSPKAMRDVIDSLVGLPPWPPSLFIDLEGVSLSRHGTVAILQLLVKPKDCTYLIDIHSLGSKAFHTPGADGQTTLKSIFESNAIPKVFFDVRNDSDALYAHFGINLAGVQDIQLMELATRRQGLSKRYLNGLTKCIEKDVTMATNELQRWKAAKQKGVDLFDPSRGGSYEVFNARPLEEEVRTYCIQDVKFMPKLWAVYDAKLISPQWSEKVGQATQDRVAISQSASFNGKGPHMRFGPWP